MGGSSSSFADLVESSKILQTEYVPLSDDAFYEEFWTLPKDPEEIFKFMDKKFINQLAEAYPSNLAALLKHVVCKIDSIVFSLDELSKDDIADTSNCVALLTRLMVAVMSDPESPLATEFMWENSILNLVPGEPLPPPRRPPKASAPPDPVQDLWEELSQEFEDELDGMSLQEFQELDAEEVDDFIKGVPFKFKSKFRKVYKNQAKVQAEAKEEKAEASPPKRGSKRNTAPIAHKATAKTSKKDSKKDSKAAKPTSKPAKKSRFGKKKPEPEPEEDDEEEDQEDTQDDDEEEEDEEEEEEEQPARKKFAKFGKKGGRHSVEGSKISKKEKASGSSKSKSKLPAKENDTKKAAKQDKKEKKDKKEKLGKKEKMKGKFGKKKARPPSSSEEEGTEEEEEEEEKQELPEELDLETEQKLFDAKDCDSPLAGRPIGEQVVVLLLELCFLPGFTIDGDDDEDEGEEEEDGVLRGKLWKSGVGGTARNETDKYDTQRTHVLQALLVLASQPVYTEIGSYSTYYDSCKFVHFLTKADPHPDETDREEQEPVGSHLITTLACSLLNTVCMYDPSNVIPYSHQLYEPDQERLVDACVQLLDVCLDHIPIAHYDAGPVCLSKMADPEEFKKAQEEADLGDNTFVDVCFSESEEDVEFVISGVCRLLNEVLFANNTYLPGSANTVVCGQELIVFLWKQIQHNSAVLPFLFNNFDLLEMFEPIIYHLYTASQDAKKVGLMYICCHILFRLSTYRQFAVVLNTAYDGAMPLKLDSFKGTYSDLLVLVCHKALISNPDHVTRLQILLAAIGNVSPFITRLSLAASIKLVNLLEVFCTPKVLEANPAMPTFLLSTITNMIQYQYQGHANLVYSILQRRELFERLHSLTTTGKMPGKGKSSKESFKAPRDWMGKWAYAGADVEVIAKLLEFFDNHVEGILADGYMTDETSLIKAISDTTLVGVLPTARPISVFSASANQETQVWFTSFLWGVLFQRTLDRIFNPPAVKLFEIQYMQDSKKEDVDEEEQEEEEESGSESED
mmetsp:Transcript_17607/g.34382  ORF Transcript_17607/g.34382 Transcript_17607/m.34382 type:complete len:1024 (+) Transcript_17607:32-3103(+)